MIDNPRIAFMAARTDEAQAALKVLTTRYGDAMVEEANVIVALGGDGFMLRSVHRTLSRKLPVYGMKLGTVGFLMNQHRADDYNGCARHRRRAPGAGRRRGLRWRCKP